MSEDRVGSVKVEDVVAAYHRMYPLGVGVDIVSVGPVQGVVASEFPEGGFVMRLTAFLDGVPNTREIRMPLRKGQHPAKVLAGLCKEAARQFKFLTIHTEVEVKGKGEGRVKAEGGLQCGVRPCGKDA